MSTEKRTSVRVENITEKEYDDLTYMMISWFGFDSVSFKNPNDKPKDRYSFIAYHEGYLSDFDENDIDINFILFSVWNRLGRYEEIEFHYYYPETSYEESKTYDEEFYDTLEIDEGHKVKYTLKDNSTRVINTGVNPLLYICEREVKYRLFNSNDSFELRLIIEMKGSDPVLEFYAKKRLISSNIDEVPETFKAEAQKLIEDELIEDANLL